MALKLDGLRAAGISTIFQFVDLVSVVDEFMVARLAVGIEPLAV